MSNTILKKTSSFIHKLRLYKAVFHYRKQALRYMKCLGIVNKSVTGEEEYITKWSVLSKWVEVSSYRLYSNYCGHIPEIVPEGIGRIIIEEKLNPPRYRDYYNDKSLYPITLGKGVVPLTLICRINGSVLLNNSLEALQDDVESVCLPCTKVVLKPSIDSSSGRGIEIFDFKNGEYTNGHVVLTNDYLLKYGSNFVLQEAIEQHPNLAYFNKTSLNTIRISTYRSVKDEKIHLLSAILRIGKMGSKVDNAHAGGRYVGVDVCNGRLGNYTCDQYGNKSNIWNDINFSNSSFTIPCWNEIQSLAKEVARRVHHHRLLALDLTVTKENKPMLIEFNIDGFSYWLFEFTNQKPLGNFTDEIIDFCQGV